jgi:hypothetical protein
MEGGVKSTIGIMNLNSGGGGGRNSTLGRKNTAVALSTDHPPPISLGPGLYLHPLYIQGKL